MQKIEFSNLKKVFSEEDMKQIMTSVKNYRSAGIDISIKDINFEQKLLTITGKQARLVNGYILTNKQLHERIKEVFNFKTDFTVYINPVVFHPDFESITPEWIEGKMKKLDISRTDLVKQLGIDKSSLSLIFSSNRGMSKPFKSAIYYYILQFEVNNNLRKLLDNSDLLVLK